MCFKSALNVNNTFVIVMGLYNFLAVEFKQPWCYDRLSSPFCFSDHQRGHMLWFGFLLAGIDTASAAGIPGYFEDFDLQRYLVPQFFKHNWPFFMCKNTLFCSSNRLIGRGTLASNWDLCGLFAGFAAQTKRF
jgi:hypothetical protein